STSGRCRRSTESWKPSIPHLCQPARTARRPAPRTRWIGTRLRCTGSWRAGSARAELDDLVQYIYLRFLQSPQHELVHNIEGYLIRIAANVVNEFALRHRREIVTFDSETFDARVQRQAQIDLWRDDLAEQLATEQQLHHVLN